MQVVELSFKNRYYKRYIKEEKKEEY